MSDVMVVPKERVCGVPLPFDLKLPLGVWIAGGAARRMCTDEELRDIDVFGSTEFGKRDFVKNNNLGEVVKETRYAKTYTYNDIPIQVCSGIYKDIEELFGSFDFSICQFAWTGEMVIATKGALKALESKEYEVCAIQKGTEFNSLRRMVKYTKKGFTPSMAASIKIFEAIRGAEPQSYSDELS